MIISHDSEFKAWVISEIAKREFTERTGVHCSDLIYCLNKQALRRLQPLPTTEREVLLFSLGWATQRWLTGKPEDEETITVDDIQVTPDCSFRDAPWELKATFTSSERAIIENDAWLRQIMAQCYVTKTLEARLTRLELMGNWKSIFGKKEDKGNPENQKPTLSAFKLVFTQEELDSNWVWLKARRERFLELIEKPEEFSSDRLLNKQLALPSDKHFECEYCPLTYKILCEKLFKV
jgi:hypothetical protein